MFASQTAPLHERGAAIYSRAVLCIYDMLVVRVSNSWIWRSPSQQMLKVYAQHLSADHLEIGPGTGWYLAHADLPKQMQLRLMDLNENSLELTARRVLATSQLTPDKIQQIHGNILAEDQPLSEPVASIGANYLLHCLPGDPAVRGKALSNMAEMLADDGVLFGSTILGDDAGHNLAGRGLMKLYNHLSIFDNCDDDQASLHGLLEGLFHHVELSRSGAVVTFIASYPRR